MSISTAKFFVQRDDVQYSVFGADLQNKLEQGDLLLINRNGHDRCYTIDDILNDIEDDDVLVCTDVDQVTYKVSGAKFLELFENKPIRLTDPVIAGSNMVGEIIKIVDNGSITQGEPPYKIDEIKWFRENIETSLVTEIPITGIANTFSDIKSTSPSHYYKEDKPPYKLLYEHKSGSNLWKIAQIYWSNSSHDVNALLFTVEVIDGELEISEKIFTRIGHDSPQNPEYVNRSVWHTYYDPMNDNFYIAAVYGDWRGRYGIYTFADSWDGTLVKQQSLDNFVYYGTALYYVNVAPAYKTPDSEIYATPSQTYNCSTKACVLSKNNPGIYKITFQKRSSTLDIITLKIERQVIDPATSMPQPESPTTVLDITFDQNVNTDISGLWHERGDSFVLRVINMITKNNFLYFTAAAILFKFDVESNILTYEDISDIDLLVDLDFEYHMAHRTLHGEIFDGNKVKLTKALTGYSKDNPYQMNLSADGKQFTSFAFSFNLETRSGTLHTVEFLRSAPADPNYPTYGSSKYSKPLWWHNKIHSLLRNLADTHTIVYAEVLEDGDSSKIAEQLFAHSFELGSSTPTEIELSEDEIDHNVFTEVTHSDSNDEQVVLTSNKIEDIQPIPVDPNFIPLKVLSPPTAVYDNDSHKFVISPPVFNTDETGRPIAYSNVNYDEIHWIEPLAISPANVDISLLTYDEMDEYPLTSYNPSAKYNPSFEDHIFKIYFDPANPQDPNRNRFLFNAEYPIKINGVEITDGRKYTSQIYSSTFKITLNTPGTSCSGNFRYADGLTPLRLSASIFDRIVIPDVSVDLEYNLKDLSHQLIVTYVCSDGVSQVNSSTTLAVPQRRVLEYLQVPHAG